MATEIELLKSYRSDPNVQQMLNIIAKAEGTDKYPNGGYNTLFGGRQVDDLGRHPKIYSDYTDLSGKKIKTSAAGRYQIVGVTHDGLQKSLKLPDFSPESQDLMAIELIKRRGALDDVMRGDYTSAIGKLGKEWASLPSSTYAQPKRSLSDLVGMSNDKIPTATVIRDGNKMVALPEDPQEAIAMQRMQLLNPDVSQASAWTNAISVAGNARKKLAEEDQVQQLPDFLDDQLLSIIDKA